MNELPLSNLSSSPSTRSTSAIDSLPSSSSFSSSVPSVKLKMEESPSCAPPISSLSDLLSSSTALSLSLSPSSTSLSSSSSAHFLSTSTTNNTIPTSTSPISSRNTIEPLVQSPPSLALESNSFLSPDLNGCIDVDSLAFAPCKNEIDVDEEYEDESCVGKPVWLPSRLKTPRLLDSYLTYVRTLFYNAYHLYCEERALFFLQQCDYQIPKATKFLKPHLSERERESITSNRNDEIDGTETVWHSRRARGTDAYVETDDFCFICHDGGSLIICDLCSKAYHPPCLTLGAIPSGYWECPYHTCSLCRIIANEKKRNNNTDHRDKINSNNTVVNNKADAIAVSESREPVFFCAHCPSSYCLSHCSEEDQRRLSEPTTYEFLCKRCAQQETAESLDLQGRVSYRRAFLKRVQGSLKRENRQLCKLPVFGGKHLDIPLLYKEVCIRGGITAVVNEAGWLGILRALQISNVDKETQYILKRFYINILYSYEKHFSPQFIPLPVSAADRCVDPQNEICEPHPALNTNITSQVDDDPESVVVPVATHPASTSNGLDDMPEVQSKRRMGGGNVKGPNRSKKRNRKESDESPLAAEEPASKQSNAVRNQKRRGNRAREKVQQKEREEEEAALLAAAASKDRNERNRRAAIRANRRRDGIESEEILAMFSAEGNNFISSPNPADVDSFRDSATPSPILVNSTSKNSHSMEIDTSKDDEMSPVLFALKSTPGFDSIPVLEVNRRS